LAGVSFWKIFAFYLHRYRAQRVRDVLDLQLQLSLRETGSAPSAVLEAIKLGWAWRGHYKSITSHLFFIILLPLLIWVGYSVASVLVANVANRSYRGVLVPLKPQNCGFVMHVYKKDIPIEATLLGKSINDSTLAVAYARTWYGRDESISNGDSIFPSRVLPYNTSFDAPCPFTENLSCVGPEFSPGSAVVFDTGLLDSHLHFGMNAPVKDRVRYRRQTTCAVVNVDNFTSTPVMEPGSNPAYRYVNIGSNIFFYFLHTNFTFKWNAAATFDDTDTTGYQLQ
jgi:hypothetical protein